MNRSFTASWSCEPHQSLHKLYSAFQVFICLFTCWFIYFISFFLFLRLRFNYNICPISLLPPNTAIYPTWLSFKFMTFFFHQMLFQAYIYICTYTIFLLISYVIYIHAFRTFWRWTTNKKATFSAPSFTQWPVVLCVVLSTYGCFSFQFKAFVGVLLVQLTFGKSYLILRVWVFACL